MCLISNSNYNIVLMHLKNVLTTLIVGCFLIFYANTASYSYSSCNSTSYLNTANLQCIQCPTNQIANTYQIIAEACQCSSGFVPNGNGLCTSIMSTKCGDTNNYYPIYSINGAYSSGISSCTSCASNARTNKNITGCTPCGSGMTYNAVTQKCICNSTFASYVSSDLGCFVSSMTPSPSSSTYSSQLSYLIPGCANFNDYLSCSYISNLCAFSLGNMATPQCQFFTANAKTTMLYANSSGFSLTYTKQGSISMKIVSYLPTGNYLEENNFILSSLMKCGSPSETGVSISSGSNIRVTCTYNVNSLLAMTGGKQWQGKLYQILIKGDDNNYYDVAVLMPGTSQSIKRFFIQDTFTNSGKSINLMTGFVLSFNYEGGKLNSPKFVPTYSSISISSGSISSPIVTMSYQVLFTCDITTFWSGALISFIIISIVALVHTIVKTYIGYLNKRSALQFFIHLAGTYSLWLYYYLLCLTGYWFLFTKTTSTPPFLLPSHSTNLYGAFYALVGIMVALRVIWVIFDKVQKLSTEVFIINWERSQFKNSWREIFVVNSLAQFYTHRTISVFWMLAIVLFFMIGVGWQYLSMETASTSTNWPSLIPNNRIFLYFINCAVFLAVGLIFKILRRISVLFWPYPFQDFADYCTVANISLLFVKRRAPHAYYLHASIPDRTQVTYKEINEAIRRGLQKNRSIGNQLPNVDSLRLYSIYLSREMEDRHAHLLKILEEQENSKRLKFGKDAYKKIPKNPRQQFIENKLKPHLQGIASGENNQRRKSMLQNICGTPPVDLREGRQRSKSEIYFDDQLEIVNQVFPNGNEFQQIHTIMVIFLGFVTLVNSTPIAAFLVYLVDQHFFKWWIEYTCRSHLQEMTKVKRGFML